MLLIIGGGGIAAGIARVWPGPTRIVEHNECDVTDPTMVTAILANNPATGVVVTAGLSDPANPSREIAVNLCGSLNIATRTTVPTVLIASVAGLYGKPNHLGYSASKAGVISVVQSLAAEGRDIWCVSPGRVDTPMRQRDYPNDTPGSRLDPAQIGQAVVDILHWRFYKPGTNVIVMKRGLETVITREHTGDGWKEELRIGLPVTI